MSHLAVGLLALFVYCIFVCLTVVFVANRAARKLRGSGIVGRILVGDIDRQPIMAVYEKKPPVISNARTAGSGSESNIGSNVAGPHSNTEVHAPSLLLPEEGCPQKKKVVFALVAEAVADLVRMLFLSPPKRKRRRRYHWVA
jgi:hypothetical protein